MAMKCARCAKLGDSCAGKKFYRMTPDELTEWCRERKKFLGLTNAEIAERSGMAPGTVDGIIARSHSDFRVSTIQPILRVLVGDVLDGETCPDSINTAEEELKRQIQQLERDKKKLEEDISWKDDKLQYFSNEIALLRNHVEKAEKQHAINQDVLHNQLKNRNRAVKILSICLGVAWLIIIAALIMDKLNPDMGFFWLGRLPWTNTGGLYGPMV